MKKIAAIKLSVSVLKQDNRYVAYSPALDLSTSGKSETEAKKRFGEAALLLIEELDKAGTLREMFKELGWKQAQKRWSPPKEVQKSVELQIPAGV